MIPPSGARKRVTGLLRRLVPRPEEMERATVWSSSMRAVHREAREDMRDAFVAAGYRASHFFPHRVHRIPKCGPDGFQLARDMCGVRDASKLWQIVVYAAAPALDEFPAAIFFDRDLVWHQQHFGRAGQVAGVDLVAHEGVLYSMAHQSDLVQRISRRRDLKTRVEKVFKGWHHLLLNAAAGFALDRGMRELRVPTAALAMRHTDRNRAVKPELFERVYDRAVGHLFAAVERSGWWCIDLARAGSRIVRLPEREETIAPGRVVCICHDVERGYGHRDVDPVFAARADAESPVALDRILAAERRLGIRATFSVVGCLLPEVRERIERDGHALAFHSYDHGSGDRQLARCRTVDYRIPGYRAPRSRLTEELTGERIHLHNVEWLASSASSLGTGVPTVAGRVARIPIAFDDFPLHSGERTYESWRRRALETIAGGGCTVFGLHDCYAAHWLDRYEEFLGEITAVAQPRTVDDVASLLYLAAGV